MRFRALLSAVVLTAIFVCGTRPVAASVWPDKPSGVSAQFVSALGGGVPGATAFWSARFGWLNRTPIALEFSAFAGYPVGGGVNPSVVFYFFHNDWLRFHVNLGIAISAEPFTSPEVPRAWDMSIGTGVELDLPPDILIPPLKGLPLTLTLEYRAFLPNPTTIGLLYGDFARAIYRDALLGGQLWLGVGFHFSR